MIASPKVELWPMISWSAQNIHQLRLVHLESWRERAASRSGLWSGTLGHSVWSGLSPQGLVGVSWQWAQLSPGVFALVDPMAVHSNLLLLGSDGSPLSPTARAMVYGRVIAGLDWQLAVAEAMKQGRRARRIDAVQVAPLLDAPLC
jgi:hypothetical protein